MRGLPEPQIPRRVKVPDFAGRLPEPIRKFTGAIHDATHLSLPPGRRPRRIAPAPRAQLPHGRAGQAAGVPGRADERELDLRRHLRPRQRHEGRRARQPSELCLKSEKEATDEHR